ncbi:MAG: autotransporter outer membrane beta-barrel domain-containing protein [Planctomycetaceae bacterium]|nr:autotransporter outer membrane beta-barrel domain-containing protein [Planctomycetaceae bacterium]
MTRNGLLTLVAVLMALALVVCPISDSAPYKMNSVQAQEPPEPPDPEDPDPEDPDPEDPWIDPGEPLPPPEPVPPRMNLTYFDRSGPIATDIILGTTATISVGNDGVTRIIGPQGIPATAINQPTSDQIGTVFENRGGPSFINAAGVGAVISVASGEPAIMNGINTYTTEPVQRIYMLRVEMIGNQERITIGFRYDFDPPNEFRSLNDPALIAQLELDPSMNGWDALPGDYQEFELFDDGNIILFPDGPYQTYADLPPNVRTLLGPGIYQLGVVWFEYVNVPDGVVLPPLNELPFPDDELPESELITGEHIGGTLYINQRLPKGSHQFAGDARTLIASQGNAIENHGTLHVFDSRIQGGTAGILHVFARDPIIEVVDDELILTGYGFSVLAGLQLYNTQIGEPGGENTFIYIDPVTGEIITINLGGGEGIAVFGDNGKGKYEMGTPGAPEQARTIIHAGDKIWSEGVNGRIIAGNDVMMLRNPIGAVMEHHPGTGAEAQYTYYGINDINGPTVGIQAQVHGYMPGRIENVYLNMSRYVTSWPSTFQHDSAYGYNQIQLNDNSWIFANTGISFGNTGEGQPGFMDTIRISIDKTSGIYAGGGLGGYIIDSSGLIYGGSTGITDRYSLIQLWAIVGDDAHPVDGGVGYSGSFHEIQVEGKVIAGAPNRAGIQISFWDISDMTETDRNRLRNVYYVDANDPDADRWGRVHFYDPSRSDSENQRIAGKFIAYNTQPSRVFWLQVNGGDPIPLTQYDHATKRWTVHPDAPSVRITGGQYGSSDPLSFFSAFDQTSGIGIDIVGTSLAWEGVILPPNVDPWSVYYGPTVRQISALGDDALITGGTLWGGGAAMSFGAQAHVGKVAIGDNNDVSNLSKVLFTPENPVRSAKNFQAFDAMTIANRAKFLYDPTLLYDDNGDNFHFDNAGVHGDIVTLYNPVAYIFGGSGTIGAAEWESTMNGHLSAFWHHGHPGDSPYNDEILGIGWLSGDGPSYLMGHRDGYLADNMQPSWTADNIPGRSIVLDEVLLWYLAGRQNANSGNYESMVLPSFANSYGYAAGPNGYRHFREALARFLHYGAADFYSGLSVPELLAGYTQDGTLVVFSDGDIFSGNIYGGGVLDPFYTLSGSVDLRFTDGTTIFNRNVLERVIGSDIYQDPGIRVRDVYVEKTGHLMLNDSWFAVDPTTPYTASPDYAERLIIHDVLNEGIVSGNGMFQIAQRWDYNFGVDYFEGHFINRGILAPGLPGYVGENEWQALELEKTGYRSMLNTVSQSPNNVMVEQAMRGVPGGQFGTITIFGHLYLMDETTRPVYDPLNPVYNAEEKLAHGQYHVTIGNDRIGDVFGKYASNIAGATATFNSATNTYDTSLLQEGEISREDWQTIAVEKLGTHLSWFSPSAFVHTTTGLPLLSQYEQFEYLTDATRRGELQRKLLALTLTPQELHSYDNNPAERARLNRKLFEENNIRFELTDLDKLLWRYGFSDVVSVHGTVPAYWIDSANWTNDVYSYGTVPPAYLNAPANYGITLLGETQLGGVVQADRIFDLDADAASKEKQTSFIIIASEGYTDGTVKRITSSTTDWVFANVDILPIQMASGQSPAVLTVIDDPNYYRNRVRRLGNNYNVLSVARTLDKAMLTNPGLALSFQFGLNSPDVLRDVFRQVAAPTRANSVVMNLTSPSDHLFNRIGYGVGGMSTGRRGDVVFRNAQTGQLQQYGQPGTPHPGQQFAPPMAAGPSGQFRGQSPYQRTGSVWGAYTHSNTYKDGDQNSFKFTSYRNGVMIGSEWNLTPSSVIGGVAMINDATLQSRSDKVRSNDYAFGMYLVAAPYEQFEIRSFMGGGYQTYDGDRYIRNRDVFIATSSSGSSYNLNDIFGINDHYEWTTKGSSFNYALEFARPFTVSPNMVFRPVLGFEYQNIRQKAYREQIASGSRGSWSNNGSNIAENREAQGATSGTYGMDYRAMTFARTLGRFGFNTESYFARGGIQMRKYYMVRLTGDRYPTSLQSFTSGSDVFSVRGANLGYHYSQLGLGSHLWLNQDRTATLFLDGDWNFSWSQGAYSVFNLGIGTQFSF